MAKIVDDNGFRTYLDVPITTEGVFDYAGFQIDQEGKFNLDKKRLYKVFRPRQELLKEEFVKSLEEMPLTDDHTPLGDGNGLLPAEKNTHGVLFNIRINDAKDGLVGDIKVFSESLKKKIDGGKKEVSLGYTCRYKPEMGMFDGKGYDFVQYDLYANHCAIVDMARMGHACRVSDSATVTCDSLELPKMPDDEKKSCADELIEKLKGCSDEDLAKVKDFLGCAEKPTEEDKKPEDEAKTEEEKPAEDVKPEDGEKKEEEVKDEKPVEEAKPEDKPAEDEKPEEKKEDEEEAKKAACDAAAQSAVAEYRKALALAEKCKPYFGTIAMDGIYTEQALAQKVCAMDSVLKDVGAESAIAALKGYLAAKGKSDTVKFRAADSKSTGLFNFAAAFKARK